MFERSVLVARAPNQQNGAAIFKGVRHGHKVVLPADAAHDTPVLQRIGVHRT